MKVNVLPKNASEYIRICSPIMILNHLFLIKCKIYRGSYFSYGKDGMLPREEPRKWMSQSFHYDNVATAMLTLFAVQTGEGWPK